MKKLFIILILITIQFSTIAQLVNIEKLRKYGFDGWQGNVELSGNFKDNDKKIVQLKNQLDLQFFHKAHNYIFINSLSLMQVNDADLINSGFQHFRYNYTVKDSSFLTFEAFVQHQYNSIKLLQRRMLIGLGTRFRIQNSDKFVLFFAPLFMYEDEVLSDELKTETQHYKLDAYLAMSYRFNSAVSFRHITYYQPHLSMFSDYRISSESSLAFKVWKNLSFETSFSLDYDSDPPAEIQNLFYSANQKISYSF